MRNLSLVLPVQLWITISITEELSERTNREVLNSSQSQKVRCSPPPQRRKEFQGNGENWIQAANHKKVMLQRAHPSTPLPTWLQLFRVRREDPGTTAMKAAAVRTPAAGQSPPGRSALPEVAEEQIVIDEAVITEEPPVNEANTNPLLRYITTALPPENRKETAADVPEQPSDQTSPPTRCKGHFENSNTRGEDQPGTSSSTLPTETGRRKRSNSTREELPLALFLPPSVLQGVGVELEVYLEPAVKRRATPVTRIPRPSTCCISSTTGQIAVSVGGAAGSFGDESSGLRAGVMRSTQAISSTGIEAIVLIGGPIVHSVPHPTKLVSMQRREVVTSASRANDEPSGSTPPAGSSGQGANGGQGSSGGAPGPSTSGNSAQGQSPGSSGGNSGQPRDTVFRSFVIVNSQEDGEASVTIRNQNEYVSGTVRTIIRKVISMSASVVSRNYGTQASTSGIRPTPRTASVRGTVEPYEQRQFPSTHHSFTRTSQVAHSSSTLPSSSRDNVALSTGLPSYTTIGAGMIVAARPTESSAQHVVALGNSESTSFSTIDALFSMNRAEQPSESFRTVMDSSNNAPNLSLQANVPTYTTAFYQGQVENTRRIANETFSRTMADHRSAAVSGAMLFGSHALDNTRQSRELAEFVVHREETAASVASFRATANGGPSCSDDEEEEEEEMREFERKSNCMSDSERSSSASTPSSLERSRNSTREPSPVADREDGEEDSRISELDDIPAVNESEDDHPSSFSRDTEPFGLEYDNLRPSIPRLPRNDSFDGEIVPSLSSNIENGLESIKQQATSIQPYPGSADSCRNSILIWIFAWTTSANVLPASRDVERLRRCTSAPLCDDESTSISGERSLCSQSFCTGTQQQLTTRASPKHDNSIQWSCPECDSTKLSTECLIGDCCCQC
ncbi:hypothetical protein L596_004081 [Steinernema carpocapsae]|uniref:Uncharacterized protein n=1 Tax=Steinernema carpocapsae TaxID=34508 RepID=A0A4U8UY43_STECR|nr:hypothetical protein L596_004081 [Steinernema carpocapsae]